MPRFVVYELASGEIVSHGACSVASLPAQAPDSAHAVLIGEGNGTTHYVRDGALVAYTPEQAASKAVAAPGAWDNDTMARIYVMPLDVAKRIKWAEVKAARDAAEFGGFVWDGSTFDSDPASQSRIQGAAQLATLAQMAGEPFAIDWTLADNTVRTLSGADMLAAGVAMGQHVQAAHEAARALREAIDAAADADELAGVVWSNPNG